MNMLSEISKLMSKCISLYVIVKDLYIQKKFKIAYSNWFELCYLYKDIFLFDEYEFKTDNQSSFIIDCGSHIGMSVLYFKHTYPDATILAFEPNPQTFKLLEKNIQQNHLTHVQLVNAALATDNGGAQLYTHPKIWHWSDSMIKTETSNYKVKIKTTKLSQYIDREIDLLKLDIEGMEVQVLKEIEPKLHHVKEIILEYHGNTDNKDNKLEDVILLLKQHEFRYKIKQNGTEVKLDEINPKDLLMIYAKKKQITINS